LAIQVELAACEHFNLLNHSIWRKPSGRHNGCKKESLHRYFPQTEHINVGNTLKPYSQLKAEYKTIKEQHRHFAVTKHVPYTNVWDFKPVQWYPGKHPCGKPSDLMRYIIEASSRLGDVVLDTFTSSGSTAIACRELVRKFVGCEMERIEFEGAVERLS
jgi:adenine-specific DNA-methyltransferase